MMQSLAIKKYNKLYLVYSQSLDVSCLHMILWTLDVIENMNKYWGLVLAHELHIKQKTV